LPTPSSRRDLFVNDVGPEAKGSKPGKPGWAHLPVKSGMDAVVFVPLSAVVTVGAAALNELGIAAAAANVTSKRKFRRIMLPSLKWLLSIAWVMGNATLFGSVFERRTGRE
jgi:hypothetical protein